MPVKKLFMIPCLLLALTLAACNLDIDSADPLPRATNTATVTGITPDGDDCDVTRVLDGDTIDVNCGEVGYRVRYVGVNTPERDEACYAEATRANRDLVEGRRVRLVRDVSNTDRFGRLLRYVYVNGVFVNEALVRDGWAEAVLYEPDRRHHAAFVELEKAAAARGAGCHPTGIFDDGSYTR